MDGKNIIQLAAAFSAGAITADYIKEEMGEGVLATVLSLAGGGVSAVATTSILNKVNDHTGIIDDLGGLVDDVLDIF